MRSIRFTCLLLAAALMMSCSSGNLSQERGRRARRAKGDIVIGAAGPWASADYMLWEGIMMAVDEINAAGGCNGRKIAIVKGDDQASVTKGQIVAQTFADNPDMVAVIGHVNSYISIPASILYEYYGLVMISPYSTNPKLTQQGYNLVFRGIPDDAVAGKALARFSAKQGFSRMMIYHINNGYGTGLANAFEKECEQLGVKIHDRTSYDSFSEARNFKNDLRYWMENFTFDAIFLAGSIPQAAVLIKEARNLGINASFVGGDGLDSDSLVEVAGKAAEGTFIGSSFHPDDHSPEARKFVEAFKRKYGKTPDAGAAQGYDCTRVLVQAIEKAGSSVPSDIAEALHNTKDWQGVTGPFSFNEHGNMENAKLSIKVVKHGALDFYE